MAGAGNRTADNAGEDDEALHLWSTVMAGGEGCEMMENAKCQLMASCSLGSFYKKVGGKLSEKATIHCVQGGSSRGDRRGFLYRPSHILPCGLPPHLRLLVIVSGAVTASIQGTGFHGHHIEKRS